VIAACVRAAPHVLCAYAQPGPAAYDRKWRLVIDDDFASWRFSTYGALLAAYLGTAQSNLNGASVLVTVVCDAMSCVTEIAPAQSGSVIAFIEHSVRV
jgi:hypothetical protein